MIRFATPALFAGLALLAAPLADAATWKPSVDPLIEDSSTQAILFGGDVLLTALNPVLTSSHPSAAGTPGAAFVDGGPGFDPLFTLSVEDIDGLTILAGNVVYTNSQPGKVEWGFALTTDATGLFGSRAIAVFTLDPALGDPLAGDIDAIAMGTLAIASATVVPLPATLPFLAASLAGLWLVRRRRTRDNGAADAGTPSAGRPPVAK